MLLNGLTPLAPGKIAAIVTYLAIHPPPPTHAEPRGSWTLAPIGSDLDRYLKLFRDVGEDWLWFSRLVMPKRELRAILEDPRVEAYALQEHGCDIGLVELDFREAGQCELAYFGLVAQAIGKGAGRFAMNRVIERAFSEPIERLRVHTCTLDHPGAAGFYLRSGFRPYRRAVEVFDDPRLSGLIPPDAAPQWPSVAEEPQ